MKLRVSALVNPLSDRGHPGIEPGETVMPVIQSCGSKRTFQDF